MSSSPDARPVSQQRTYDRRTSVVFRKTNERFGGLSNMAPGFPIEVNGLSIRTAEALYQACRFPHRPELQRLIIEQRSPMTAKMVGRPHRHDTRRDWDRVRVAIMRWCLRVKLAQNWPEFSELLLATGDRPIVEDSRRDDFWGAIRVDGHTLTGMNVLGRLLMELRQQLRIDPQSLAHVEPPSLDDFLLDGQVIPRLIRRPSERFVPAATGIPAPSGVTDEVQASLFDGNGARMESDLMAPQGPERGLIGLPVYAEYRDSGTLWLDSVPRHWNSRRLKTVTNNVNEQTSDLAPDDRYVALEDVESWTGRVRPKRDASPASTVRRFQPNDVLFGKLRPYLAKVARLDLPGVCVGEFLVLRPRDGQVSSPFLEHLLRSRPVIDIVNASTFGAKMPRADWDFIGNLVVALPPPDEQAAIVRFIEHADRRIARYVRAKQRLIALLEEQKQAITQRAVARGLDHEVRLRPSGVEWLGDIPEHWEVLRSRYAVREIDRRSTTGEETHLSMSQKLGLVPRAEVESWRLTSESYLGGKLCETGDLVLNRLKAHLGVFALAKQSGVVSADYTVLRPQDGIEPRYAEAIFRTPACRTELRRRAKGIVEGFWRLYTDDFYDIRVPIPPLEEQRAIMRYIEVAVADVVRSMERVESEIQLLREYRTRLIADVVTGKLDVRAAAAGLPEEDYDVGSLDGLDALVDDEEMAENEFAEGLQEGRV